MSDPPATMIPPAPSTAGNGGAPGRHPGPRRRWLVAGATLVALLAVGVASLVWLGGDGEDGDRVGESPTTAAPRTTPPSEPGAPAPITRAPATTAPPAEQPDASGVLAAFFSAAAAMDGQLHAAAAAINDAGPPWESVTEDVAVSVQAADGAVVAGTIPAGLPDDLLQAVILVYSDLASRRAAMQSFAHAGALDGTVDALLAELGNGHAAAARFDSDLAAARSLAAAAPPVEIAPPDSREAAEVLLLVQYVDGVNAGCDSRGGVVVTELPVITWASDSHGTIGQAAGAIGFEATLGGDGWEVEIRAC